MNFYIQCKIQWAPKLTPGFIEKVQGVAILKVSMNRPPRRPQSQSEDFGHAGQFEP